MSGAGVKQEELLAIVSGEDRRLRADLIRAGLWMLTPLYGLVITAYRGMYDAGMLAEARLSCPVVSIGNLTVGGTGKTGLALALARMLRRAGLRPALLNYGYRAGIGRGPAVVSDGERIALSPAEAGDEAVMLAESLPGVPVLIGHRRTESGALAIERFAPDLLILDDAFQYWRLARDIDLVLIDATEPWGHNALLPRGLLREMPTALRRASGIVITHTNVVPAASLRSLRADIAKLAPRAPVFEANYAPAGLYRLIDVGTRGSPNSQPVPRSAACRAALSGLKVGALSALGRPDNFEDALSRLGAAEVVPYRFPDHAAYSIEEIETVVDDTLKRGLDCIVTTAKDAVKLRNLDLAYPEPTIYTLESDFEVEPRADFKRWVLDVVARVSVEN